MGWYPGETAFWTEPGAGGEVLAFAKLPIYIKHNGEWSMPIWGVGGSKLVALEKGRLVSNDEGYKMAETDALSVAMKKLGVAGDIYAGKWDGSKYINITPEKAVDDKQDGPQAGGKIKAEAELVVKRFKELAGGEQRPEYIRSWAGTPPGDRLQP